MWLFANENTQKDKQEEQMKIIDMLHGTVFIVDPIKNKILFEKEKQEEDF